MDYATQAHVLRREQMSTDDGPDPKQAKIGPLATEYPCLVCYFLGEGTMPESTHRPRGIVAAAEREMKRHSLLQELSETIIRVDSAHTKKSGKTLGPFITISREAGAGGEDVAYILGERLGWDVLDKNALDLVAERYCLSRSMLDEVDEAKNNWVHNAIGPVFDAKVVPREKYMSCLERIFITAARKGKVIFVGRGARFVLPDNAGLAVRLVASEKYRVRRMQQEKGISEQEARKLVRELDKGRRDFVQHFFRRDVADPHYYDIVLNTERLGPETAVEIILDAHQRMFGSDA